MKYTLSVLALLILAGTNPIFAQACPDIEGHANEVAADSPLQFNDTYNYCFLAEGSATLPGGNVVTQDLGGEITIEGPLPLPFTITVTDRTTGATQTLTPATPIVILGGRTYDSQIVTGGTPGSRRITFTSDRLPFIGRIIESFILAVDNAAPVTWMDPLSYEQRGKTLHFGWSVADQVDVANYELERDLGDGFVPVQTIAPRTAGNREVAYAARDLAQSVDILYRIRQWDLDGQYSFSNVVLVPAAATDATAIFPNPARASVNFSGAREVVEAVLLSVDGREVLRRSLGAASAGAVDLTGAGPGLYLLRLFGTDGTPTDHRLLID